MLYAIIAIVFFGFLIATHEAGHMFAAKACGVKVNEYSIGMGPALWARQRGETKYSLRLFPVGGYCAIEGENGDSQDPRALCSQPVLKQIFVFIAGVTVNFLTGLIICFFIYATATGIVVPKIVGFEAGFPYEGVNGIQVGDIVYAVNDTRVYIPSDIQLILMTTKKGPNGQVSFTVERNGEYLKRNLTETEYITEDGTTYTAYGFTYGGVIPASFGNILKYTWLNTIDFVRIVGFNFKIIANKSAGIDDLRGPVGIVSEITQIGKETEESHGVSAAFSDIMYYVAMIAVNLAVMNLLPIPALDGGHIVVLLVDTAIFKLFHKKMNLKAVNIVTYASFVLVLALMTFITFKDIARLLL